MRALTTAAALALFSGACSGSGVPAGADRDAASAVHSAGGSGASGGGSSAGGAGGGDSVSGGGPGVGGVGPFGAPLPSGGASGVAGHPGAGGSAPTDVDAGTCNKGCGTHRWACWPMPNPARAGLPNEASYTELGDGTVRDNVTCLIWQKVVSATSYTVLDGSAYCRTVGPGFRLATRIELMSILDFTATAAKVDGGAFPGTPRAFFKSGSEWVLTTKQIGAGKGTDLGWAFNFSDGIASNARSSATPDRVRCVKGGGDAELDAAPGAIAVPPPNQYTAVAPGEAGDSYTGLVWQAEFSAAQMSWADAGAYCSSLALNGHTWRLPSIRELSTLVDEAQVAPAINRTLFSGTKYGARSNNWYWASHRAAGSTTAAWAINFDDGFTGKNDTTDTSAWNYFTNVWVRCVR
jgi:hypothetical protein